MDAFYHETSFMPQFEIHAVSAHCLNETGHFPMLKLSSLFLAAFGLQLPYLFIS